MKFLTHRRNCAAVAARHRAATLAATAAPRPMVPRELGRQRKRLCPGLDKAPQAIPRNGFARLAGARVAVIASAEPQK